MISGNLFKLPFVWNLHDEEVCGVYSYIFWCPKVRLCNKHQRNIYFLIPYKQLSDYWMKFFIFFFPSWVAFLNTIVDILDIIQVFICVLQRYCSAPINIEISCDSIECLYFLIIISTQSSLVDFLSEYILCLTPEPFTVLSACFISLLCCQHASLVYCVVRNALLVFKHDF